MKTLKLKLWEKMRLSILKKHCWKQSLKLQDRKGNDARSKFKKLLPTLFCKRRHSDGVPDEKIEASTLGKSFWNTGWIFFQRKVSGTSRVSWFWAKDRYKNNIKYAHKNRKLSRQIFLLGIEPVVTKKDECKYRDNLTWKAVFRNFISKRYWFDQATIQSIQQMLT